MNQNKNYGNLERTLTQFENQSSKKFSIEQNRNLKHPIKNLSNMYENILLPGSNLRYITNNPQNNSIAQGASYLIAGVGELMKIGIYTCMAIALSPIVPVTLISFGGLNYFFNKFIKN